MVEPIILIFFDRNINLLARYMYCDRESFDATQIAYLMSQARRRDEAAAEQTASIEMMMNDATTTNDAIPLTPLSRDSDPHAFMPLAGSCRHCSPTHSSVSETTPLYSTLRGGARSNHNSPQTSSPGTAQPQPTFDVHMEPPVSRDSSYDRQFKPVRGHNSGDSRNRAETLEEDIQC